MNALLAECPFYAAGVSDEEKADVLVEDDATGWAVNATRLTLSKARRAELRVRWPVGLVYDPRGQVVLDPDRQVQETIGLFFITFFRLGAAMATVRYFREQHVLFPRRVHSGPRQGELV